LVEQGIENPCVPSSILGVATIFDETLKKRTKGCAFYL